MQRCISFFKENIHLKVRYFCRQFKTVVPPAARDAVANEAPRQDDALLCHPVETAHPPCTMYGRDELVPPDSLAVCRILQCHLFLCVRVRFLEKSSDCVNKHTMQREKGHCK